MTYYDRVTQVTKNPNWHRWDYYKCHSGSDFDYIFAHPQSFISETFIYAKKHMLTSSVVGDKYQFNTPDISCPRAAHSISSFFLGFILADGLTNGNLDNFFEFDEFTSKFPFTYIWNLTSLYHDYGYQYENDIKLRDSLIHHPSKTSLRFANSKHNKNILELFKRKLNIRYSIWSPKYINSPLRKSDRLRKDNRDLIEHIDRQTIDKFIHDNIKQARCNNRTLNIPTRSYTLINQYLNYRLNGMSDYSCVDHGIAGGIAFYDLIIKNYLWEYYKRKERYPNTSIYEFRIKNIVDNRLRFGLDQTIMFLYVADCIINHNIWKASDKTESVYREYGLHFLVGDKFQKINFHKNPLLFILCMADTLEPYKNYYWNEYGCGIDNSNYHKENVVNMFNKYHLTAERGKIIIQVPDTWQDSCKKKLDDMKEWIDIDYNQETNRFVIQVL